jgi:hypothetical protein
MVSVAVDVVTWFSASAACWIRVGNYDPQNPGDRSRLFTRRFTAAPGSPIKAMRSQLMQQATPYITGQTNSAIFSPLMDFNPSCPAPWTAS